MFTARNAVAAALICALLAAVPAHAQSTAETVAKLRAEAGSFFTQCPSGPSEAAKMCQYRHDQLTTNYICAFSGNWTAENNVYSLLNDWKASSLSNHVVLTCAWGLVSMSSHNSYADTGDNPAIQESCSFTGSAALASAMVRATLIGTRIQALSAFIKPTDVCPWNDP